MKKAKELFEKIQTAAECNGAEVQVLLSNVKGDLAVSATVMDARASHNSMRCYSFVLSDIDTVDRYGEYSDLIDHLDAVSEGETDEFVDTLDERRLYSGRI